MPVRKITRRAALAGAAAALATPAFARPPRGGSPQTPAVPLTGGLSRTIVNTSASPTPTDWVTSVMMEFQPGDVPAGSIAEPEVAGVPQVYNVSQASLQHFGDGSLWTAEYHITQSGALAAGAPRTYDFRIKPGTFGATSSITEAAFIAETDFRYKLSKVHTARTPNITAQLFALTINSITGQVDGAKVYHPANMTVPTQNVLYGNGAGAQISITGGVPTIVNPGSGYSYVGTGTYEATLNSIFAAVAAGGNNANGVSWEWVAKGPACDELKATIVLPLAHYHVRFYIRRWKKVDGSFLDYSFDIRGTIGTIGAASMHNYTFDLDILENVSGFARGASTGHEPYTTIIQNVGSGVLTVDEKADSAWLGVNGAAFNAIRPVLTQAECLYFRRAAGLPYDTVLSTRALPVGTAYWADDASAGNDEECGLKVIGKYRPGGTYGLRKSTQNSPSDTNLFAGSPECLYYYWLQCYHGNRAAALQYLNNVAVTIANGSSVGNMGGGMLIEPSTTYLPNVYPASQYSFPGMTPTRESGWMEPATMNILGTHHPKVWGSPGTGSIGWINTSHKYNISFHPYLLLGKEWMRDNAVYAGLCNVFGLSYSVRLATIAGRTYRRVWAGGQIICANVRIAAWYRDGIGKSTRLLREGSVERAHYEQVVDDNYSYLNTLPGFVGTLTHAGVLRTKSIDFSGKGTYPDQFFEDCTDLAVAYMDDYEARADVVNKWIWQGSALGAKMKQYVDYRSVYYVGRYLGPGHIYWSQCQRARVRKNISSTAGVAVDIPHGVDPLVPGYGIHGTAGPQGKISCHLAFTAGSDVITILAYGSNVPTPIILWGTTEMPSGARIALTRTSTHTTGATGTVPPGFTENSEYYWLRLTPTTGKLCTDAALLNPVVSPTTVGTNCFFYVIPNINPPDLSYGTHFNGASPSGGSRVAWNLGVLRQSKALALPGESTANLTLAISRLNAVWLAIGGAYGDTIFNRYTDTI